MKKSVYEYERYKPFINELIQAKGSEGRGTKKSLANALNCQSPFISQVLSGDLDFNHDQAFACARFFGLNQDETEYFMLLVSLAKASTPDLKRFYLESLESKREVHRQIMGRMKIKKSLKTENQIIYYSSWVYSAVHMALTIPEVRTREALAKKMKLSLESIDQILNFLVESGLAQKTGIHFEPTDQWYHLDKSSPMISKHHTNLHIKAIQSLDSPMKRDLHYSAFFTCSKKDLGLIEELILKTLSEFNELVKPSKEEELAAINLSLFQI